MVSELSNAQRSGAGRGICPIGLRPRGGSAMDGRFQHAHRTPLNRATEGALQGPLDLKATRTVAVTITGRKHDLGLPAEVTP